LFIKIVISVPSTFLTSVAEWFVPESAQERTVQYTVNTSHQTGTVIEPQEYHIVHVQISA